MEFVSSTGAAKRIRAELKSRGWNSRAISVRVDSYSLGSTIRVTIKTPDAPISVVREVAEHYQVIHQCETTGEILSGGNRHVEVAYAPNVLGALAAPLEQLLRTVEDDPGTVVELPNGWQAFKTDEPGEYWRAWCSDDTSIHCWGREFCARQIVIKGLDAPAKAA